MLTDAQVAQYNRDGYVLVTDLLESDTLDTLRAVTDQIVAGANSIDVHTDALDLEDSHRADAPRVRRIKRPHLVHPFYRELAAHPAIMAALTPLIGENIRLRPGGKVNIKAPGYGAPVEWHQDWAFYPHTNRDVLAVGILLDDMDPDNGPIMFLPGSHLGPIHDHHSCGAFCGAIDVSATGLDVSDAREIHAPAMRAMTRSLPPHLGQVSMSMAKTRFGRRIQVMGARGLSGFSWRGLRFGTTDSRCLRFGANTPWNRVRFNRGRGTNAARRAMKSSGSRTTWVEPSRNGCLNR